MDYDVIVIGGGAAGLSGATVLARSRRRVLVIDSGHPRNAPAEGVHAFLSRDGIAPGELLKHGAREFGGYGGELHAGEAAAADQIDGGFAVTTADDERFTARRLLVTTGAVDELPDVPGLRDRWGRDVVHCPYCHGWEVRDKKLVVLASNALYPHHAMLFSQLTDDVTVLLHEQPEPDADTARRLDALGARVVAQRATGVEVVGDKLTGIRLADGELLRCEAITVATKVVARSAVLDGLGLTSEPFLMGDVKVATHIPTTDPTGRTAVPGVWVAGNVTTPNAQVITSAAAAVMAAAMMNMDLIEEDLAAKLAG